MLCFITNRTLNDTIATWPGHSQWTDYTVELKDLYWPGLVSLDTCKDEVTVTWCCCSGREEEESCRSFERQSIALRYLCTLNNLQTSENTVLCLQTHWALFSLKWLNSTAATHIHRNSSAPYCFARLKQDHHLKMELASLSLTWLGACTIFTDIQTKQCNFHQTMSRLYVQILRYFVSIHNLLSQ